VNFKLDFSKKQTESQCKIYFNTKYKKILVPARFTGICDVFNAYLHNSLTKPYFYLIFPNKTTPVAPIAQKTAHRYLIG
jgi:hypothetical protein